MRSARLLLVGLFLGAAAVSAWAHECGPQLITLKVGEACLWRIVADKFETTTAYTPVLAGPAGVAEATPKKAFNSKHGDFVIRGLAPGTNVLVVNWNYPRTPAAGVCTVTIIVEALKPGEILGQTPDGNGQLSTAALFKPIEAQTLRAMIDAFVPGVTPKLLVLTECYAGNIALSGFFKNMPLTAIMTGNSANQQGVFGGYHDDAARALAPAEGKTAEDVHYAGTVGRHSIHLADDGAPDDKETTFMSSEFPLVSGGLALNAFSLAPVSATGAVRSRHVVVYAGAPSVVEPKLQTHDGKTIPLRDGTKTVITDAADRETIKGNFAGQPNTTVTTAGGEPQAGNRAAGQDGWDFSGTYEGLRAAIKKAGDEIRKSPNPELEQFIFFVGDHGMQGNTAPPAARPVAPNSRSQIAAEMPSMRSDSSGFFYTEQDVNNESGFLLFLDFGANPVSLPAGADGGLRPLFNPNDLALEVERVGDGAGEPMSFGTFVEQAAEIDGDDRIGTTAGEGIGIFFPVMEQVFLRDYVDAKLNLTLVNRTARGFNVAELHQVGGSLQRLWTPVPRPKILEPKRAAGGGLELVLRGTKGQTYAIESLAADGNWRQSGTVTLTAETGLFRTGAAEAGRGFFRARLVE